MVWTKQVQYGGVVGGDFGTNTYYWNQYDYKWNPFRGYATVVIDARLYYNQRLLASSSNYQGLSCIDIRTGEEIWFKNGTTIWLDQLLNYETPNQHGVFAY